jgi:hypothetical protein
MFRKAAPAGTSRTHFKTARIGDPRINIKPEPAGEREAGWVFESLASGPTPAQL